MDKNIIKFLIVFMTGGFVLHQPLRADLNRKKVNKGIKAYQQQQWDEALNHFQDARLDDPESPVGYYNLAEAFYQKKNYEEAQKNYEKALSSQDVKLKEQAYYNLGNTHYQLNKYQEAIDNYKKALELDPSDQDAKHNLELVRAKLKEMAQKQPQQNQQQNQQSQQQQNNQDQQQQQQQDQDQSQQNQGENQQEEQQQQAQQNPEQNQEEQQQQDQEINRMGEKKKELSKEEAERILQALKSKEKDNQKLRREKHSGRRRRVEKDW